MWCSMLIHTTSKLKKLIQRFEKIVHSRKTRIWLSPDSPRKKIADSSRKKIVGVLMSLNNTVQNPDNDYT
ncbi:hypothetical protein Hanom_Chr11g01025121 [Helianthus anomalus]